MKPPFLITKLPVLLIIFTLTSCGEDSPSSSSNVVDQGITASAGANSGTSYTISKANIQINYSALNLSTGSGYLKDPIAYLDADGDTDVFMATGEYLLDGEVNSALLLNNGANIFTSSTVEIAGNKPPGYACTKI